MFECDLFNSENLSLLFSFNCLHYRGRCHHLSATNSTFGSTNKNLSCVYYVKNVGEYQRSAVLGFLDILFYDILLLLVIPVFIGDNKSVCNIWIYSKYSSWVLADIFITISFETACSIGYSVTVDYYFDISFLSRYYHGKFL